VFENSNSHAQSAETVEVALVGSNFLQSQHVPALIEQLCKFPALKQLDLTANSGMGCGGAVAIVSALSGILCTGVVISLSFCEMLLI
jgi:hypothetical protein